MTDYVELAAVKPSELDKLDNLFVSLSREMVRVRQAMETTRSSSFASKKEKDKEGTVILLSDDWDVINAPEEPIKRYAYRTQSRTSGKCSHC